MHTYKYNYLQKSKQTKDASHIYDLSKSVDYVTSVTHAEWAALPTNISKLFSSKTAACES